MFFLDYKSKNKAKIHIIQATLVTLLALESPIDATLINADVKIVSRTMSTGIGFSSNNNPNISPTNYTTILESPPTKDVESKWYLLSNTTHFMEIDIDANSIQLTFLLSGSGYYFPSTDDDYAFEIRNLWLGDSTPRTLVLENSTITPPTFQSKLYILIAC